MSPGATGGGTWLSAGKYKFFINYYENRFPIAPFTLGLVEGVFFLRSTGRQIEAIGKNFVFFQVWYLHFADFPSVK